MLGDDFDRVSKLDGGRWKSEHRLLRDLIRKIVLEEAPPVSQQGDPLHGGRKELYNLLKLGLSEEDAPVEAQR